MMIPFTDEEKKLFDLMEKTSDKKEIAKINERLREIYEKQREELKDCPFVH